MKQLEVVWTPGAAKELSNIVDRIFRASGHRRTADRYGEKILAAATRIGSAAEVGRRRDDLDEGLRTWIVDRKFIIFYRIVGSRVRIVRVVDGRRDYPRLFRARPDTPSLVILRSPRSGRLEGRTTLVRASRRGLRPLLSMTQGEFPISGQTLRSDSS